MKYVGIDPSTKTGWAVVDTEHVACGTCHYPELSPELSSLAARVLRVTMGTRNLMSNIERPLVVCIEAYSMASNGAHHSLLIEIGYEIRRSLTGLDCNPRVYEVAPATLKKWATGKGNADKVAVASAMAKRYDREFASDNESDAFALAMMAAQIGGDATPQTEFQREAIDTVINGAKKRAKKSRKRS